MSFHLHLFQKYSVSLFIKLHTIFHGGICNNRTTDKQNTKKGLSIYLNENGVKTKFNADIRKTGRDIINPIFTPSRLLIILNRCIQTGILNNVAKTTSIINIKKRKLILIFLIILPPLIRAYNCQYLKVIYFYKTR